MDFTFSKNLKTYICQARGPGSLNSRSGSGRSGSGSEIFERLPDSGLQGEEGSGSEDSSVYRSGQQLCHAGHCRVVCSQLDSLDRGKRGQQGRRLNGEAGRGARPGHQAKHRKHKGDTLERCLLFRQS